LILPLKITCFDVLSARHHLAVAFRTSLPDDSLIFLLSMHRKAESPFTVRDDRVLQGKSCSLPDQQDC
jgi:hypothetical protein